MPNNYEYIEVIANSETTFGELLVDTFNFKSTTELTEKTGYSITELLEYKPYQIAAKNKYLIEQYYDDDEYVEYGNNDTETKLVKSGTRLAFPGSLEEFAVNSTQKKLNNVPVEEYKDFESFIGKEIEELIQDEKYAPIERVTSRFKGQPYKVNRRNVEITVLVWSRALERVINLSPFVVNMDTSVAEQGGQFNISLPPLTIPETQSFEKGPLNFTWDMLYNNITIFKQDGKYNYTFKDSAVFQGEIVDQFGGSTLTNFNPKDYDAIKNNKRILDKNLFFNIVLSHQDLVFIKFERLIFDEDKIKDLKQFELLNLPDTKGEVWDMIGLIDNVNMVRNEMSNDYFVQVQGRDLMKLIIQDGVYVFPLTTANFQESFVANASEIQGDKSYTRLFGEVQDLTLQQSQPIKNVLEFILKKFSKIEVIDDDLFGYLDDDAENTLNKLGLWRLTNLLVDESVANRYIRDSGLATDTGSLINFFNRICQKPFVEFFGDTYGDKYYWIVRKPPYTKKSILSNYTINISREQLLNISLGFGDQQVYSWYRFTPLGSYFGDQQMSKFFLPAAYFPEYAKIWGANPLDIQSNYLYFGVGQDPEILSNGQKQAVEDLKFIISSNAYNPFVRSGNITINPDRRIKYGMNVYLNSTDEIFRVGGVTQSYAISDQQVERITQVQVINGMVLSHIDKYFNVIDLPLPTGNNVDYRKLKWKVNPEIFDFLLRKKQFFKNLTTDRDVAFNPYPDTDSKKSFFKPEA